MAIKFYNAVNLALACTLLLTLGSIVPATAPILAQTNNAPIKPDVNDPAYINSVAPGPISDADLSLVKQIALADNQVKALTTDKNIDFMATHYFSENILANPVKWSPEININVANTSEVTVQVDLQAKTVKSVATAPIVRACVGDCIAHTFAVDWVTTISPSPNYLDVRSPAPTYTRTVNPVHTGWSFLLDAVMDPNPGGDYPLCHTPTGYYTNYWAQVGFNWNLASDTKPIYTDTKFSCIIQFTSLTYTAGHNYKFEINASTNNHSTHKGWTLIAIDLSTLSTFYYFANYDVNTGKILTGTTTDTNVMFESREKNSEAPNWYNDFGTITANSAHYSTNGGSSVFNWPNEGKEDVKCDGGFILPSVVISGGLKTGGTATWNKLNFYNSVNC